ncbi:hypothetical protein [Bacillus sp. B15-48]|uniref:tetratricopeptide repeat protein n=1 Tax=Bacillus sp. B15-48 TaxID=1548601 RepID=UPI00193F511F|nr:hypothetical protein [Bacillus sp. B15-48]MBM4761350.1 hypothetical protein [Bacillus sp. B15-48]
MMQQVATSEELEAFIGFHDSLPEDTARKFETAIADWSLEHAKTQSELLYNLLEGKMIVYHENPTSIRFTAFASLCVYLRRLKDGSKHQALFEKYGHEFVSFKLYPHLCSMMYRELRTMDSFSLAVEYAEEAVRRLPEQEGVLHNYAEAVIVAAEEGLELEPAYLSRAEKDLRKAMFISPKYPKFHCTKGRLLVLKKKYKEASESILKAIDLEDSDKPDYILRINDYQNYLANIRNEQLNAKMEESIHELTVSKETLEKSLESTKTENLQMLGFFIAIITFTIGSFNLVKLDKVLDTVFLLFVLTGCLIISYVAFTILFSNKNTNKWKIIGAFSLGMMLLGLGFAIHTFM